MLQCNLTCAMQLVGCWSCCACLVLPVFRQSNATATIFLSLHISMRLLFEGSVYFFGKPADIDGWIRYV